MTDRALDGVRIIEFTDELGSYCGRLLADLGADVIKVEPPGGGRERHTPPFYRDEATPDTSLAFWVHNTSKKSVVLDLDIRGWPCRRPQPRRTAADRASRTTPSAGWPPAASATTNCSAANPALVYVFDHGIRPDRPARRLRVQRHRRPGDGRHHDARRRTGGPAEPDLRQPVERLGKHPGGAGRAPRRCSMPRLRVRASSSTSQPRKPCPCRKRRR